MILVGKGFILDLLLPVFKDSPLKENAPRKTLQSYIFAQLGVSISLNNGLAH